MILAVTTLARAHKEWLPWTSVGAIFEGMRFGPTRPASAPGLLGALLLLLPPATGADEVHLHNGGVVHGVIVERTDDAVVLEAGPGRVTLPLSRVSRIVEARSALATFQERAATIPWNDVGGLADLARWAGDRDLATHSLHAWERVLALDPDHPEANEAMGRVYYGGAWMSPAEAYRAQGLVPFEGGWVTAAEHDAAIQRRAADDLAVTEQRTAELRVREAEARAREAEARAREAESSADRTLGSGDGIPYWWVLSGGGGPSWPGGYPPGPPTTLPERPGTRPPTHPPHTQPRSRTSSPWAKPSQPTRPPARPHESSSGSRGGGGSSSGGSGIH